jgi:hypothetical protein
MTAAENLETPNSIDEQFQFKTASPPKSTSANEIEALKAEIEYLRRLNEENVATGQKLKDKFKVNFLIF